jgi:hypothetical protein
MGLASRFDLELLQFAGFLTISELRMASEVIPREAGVYAIIWQGAGMPDFLAVGTGGWFKGIDPNVPLSILAKSWVIGPQIVYIGKAAAGTSGKRGLRKRLTEYLDFGKGVPVGHRGGRYIWQLEASDQLIVCWKTVQTSPEVVEREMLRSFVSEQGRLPFANLRH